MSFSKNNRVLLNRILNETEIVEAHNHTRDRFFGRAAAPNAEIHCADPVGSSPGAFQIDAGNNDFGAWVCILGSSDTPLIADRYYHDISKIEIVSTERIALHIIQICFGTGTPDAAYTAGDYTETLFNATALSGRSVFEEIKNPRIPNGTKMWARCKCPGQNTATLDFYWGAHSYPVEEL